VQKVLDDALVESVGPNKWVGDAKPTFSFVTLAPKQIGVDAWVYDSMILRPGDWYRVRKLTIHHGLGEDDQHLPHLL
jgi:hypothetical protein